MLLLTSSWKKRFHIYFFIVFLSNASKSCAPFMEIFFPHDKFLDWKFPKHFPLFSTPASNQKILLKTPVYFPITITICEHWSKFWTCNPSPGGFGGVSRPQRHSYKVFRTTLNKMAISEFWSVDFGKIISVGGGLGTLQFFWSLKNGTRTFHFR